MTEHFVVLLSFAFHVVLKRQWSVYHTHLLGVYYTPLVLQFSKQEKKGKKKHYFGIITFGLCDTRCMCHLFIYYRIRVSEVNFDNKRYYVMGIGAERVTFYFLMENNVLHWKYVLCAIIVSECQTLDDTIT